MRPSADQMKAFRQAEMTRKALPDPATMRAHAEAALASQRRDQILVRMPDEATRKVMLEAARYFDSTSFAKQREAVLRAGQAAHQRLGSEGLAAASRIVARSAATDENQKQSVNRIETGQATAMLEEATRLAASAEVREAIEQANPETLAQFDEEQGAAVTGLDPEILESEAAEWETAAPDTHQREYFGFNQQDLLKMHDQALIVLLPLEAALFFFMVANPDAPIVVSLTAAVSGLITLLTFTKLMISRWEDGGETSEISRASAQAFGRDWESKDDADYDQLDE